MCPLHINYGPLRIKNGPLSKKNGPLRIENGPLRVNHTKKNGEEKLYHLTLPKSILKLGIPDMIPEKNVLLVIDPLSGSG